LSHDNLYLVTHSLGRSNDIEKPSASPKFVHGRPQARSKRRDPDGPRHAARGQKTRLLVGGR